MLLAERLVWIPLEDKALEEGPIEVQSVTLFNREVVIIDLGAQLPSLIVSVGINGRNGEVYL